MWNMRYHHRVNPPKYVQEAEEIRQKNCVAGGEPHAAAGDAQGAPGAPRELGARAGKTLTNSWGMILGYIISCWLPVVPVPVTPAPGGIAPEIAPGT